MPGRQSHGGPPTKGPKARVNNKKRSLNAFAIAAQQHPEKIKIRRNRLGESEGGSRPGKRRRQDEDDDDEEEEEESNTKKQKKTAVKGRFDELDIEEGSDSEGNEWRMGHVDSDDDSDLDSDEAFGESDEERFEDFTFSGSTEKSKKKKPKARKNVTLDEMDDDEEESESDDESLGDDAIDLAAMLDATEDDEEDTKDARESKDGGDKSDPDSLADSEESDDDSSASSMEDSDDENPDKVAALQNLIANLPQADTTSKTLSRQRSDGASEYNTPSDFGVTSKTKLTLEDLGIPSVRDPYVKKSLKLLAAEEKGETKRNGKLAVPLAKRQQDRLDRSAAYEKSKETLSRWKDTVAHNRRAEHLIFPLPDPDANSMNANARLQPTTNSKPFNELEATIQKILEESGLATVDGRDDEDKIREFEELETKNMSLEDVKARRDQLRMARDLMFREEARSKRIKKIKSKSYRRVHRKQREKEERMNQEALLEAGVVPSEDELEAQDRRRAEERMGSRHRGSKWAKANKATGRAAWDEDARAGITDMARRDEELRKRVEGRVTRNETAQDSESSSDSEEDSQDDQDTGDRRLLRKLDGVEGHDAFADAGTGSKLTDMKFMRNAEAARKKENDQTVEQMRKELAGEGSDPEPEILGDVGRRTFGPGSKTVEEMPARKTREGSDFEGFGASDDESLNDGVTDSAVSTAKPAVISKTLKVTERTTKTPHMALKAATPTFTTADHEGGAWSQAPSRKDAASQSEARRSKQKMHSTADVDELDLTNAAVIAKPFKAPKKSAKAKKASAMLNVSDDESDAVDEIHLPFAIRDQELIKRAFAGADVVGDFEAEKRQTIEDEDEKVIDNTIPGWGSWVGDGLNKRDKAKNKGRFLTKSEGIKEQNRKDAKMERVIINEKRVKKNGKYLASSLPHPFETKQQYERSLRLPVGPEWTTKETFQDATKPRILLKQGVIAPMSKPLL